MSLFRYAVLLLLVWWFHTTGLSAATLVAEYRFDSCLWNGSTGEIKDNILGDNNGTPTGTNVSTTTLKRKVCHSAQFSGDAIDIDNLDINTSLGAKNSVAFWMYWDGTGGVMPFGWYAHDLWFTRGAFGFNSFNSDIYGISSAGLENGWHHVAAVFTNGDMHANTLYIDGVEQNLTQRYSSPVNARSVASSSARLGGCRVSDGYRFRGYLDEMRIYNGEINASAVNAIMNTTHTCRCVEPLGDWRLDECLWEGSNNEVYDSSGNNYHGTAQRGATTQSAADALGGQCRTGLLHDQYITLPTFPHLTHSRSITAWFKTTDISQRGQRIFADDEYNSLGSYALSVGDPGAGKIRFYIRGLNAVSLDSAAVIQNNQWYFAAATFDAATMTKRLRLYDSSGTLISDVQATVSGVLHTQNGTPSLGGETANGEVANRFNGNIDEVKVFDAAIDTDQIQAIMVQSHPCGCAQAIASYRFDECFWDGSVAEVGDDIGKDNNGTRTGINATTSTTQRQVCRSAFLDGDVIDIDNLDIDTALGAKNSVAFWMYWDGTSNVMPFGWYAHDLWFSRGAFGFNSFNSDIYGISSAGLENGWHHVAAVFTNGNMHANTLYIDGVEQNLTQIYSSPRSYRSVANSSARIGGCRVSNGYRFRGYLDEFYIFKGELKAVEIQKLMFATHPCQSCGLEFTNTHFNAWDTFRSLTDQNISTKYAQNTFSLTLAALNPTHDNFQEFNGTVCTQIVDVNHANAAKSSWVKSFFNEANATVITLNSNGAVKNARLVMAWKRNVNESCPLVNEDNSTLSADNFALRPERFHLSLSAAPYYAAEAFRLHTTALSPLGTTILDYNETQGSSYMIDANETRRECRTSTEQFHVANNAFVHGERSDINASFSGLASYLTIRIHEINGSEFATVDRDDTNDTQRLITPYEYNITTLPYELNITQTRLYASTVTDWLYMADINDMNASLHVKLQAFNKEHHLLEDFNASCYAHDIGIRFGVTSDGNQSIDMNYSAAEGTFSDGSLSKHATLGEINQSMTIPSGNFEEGIGYAVMDFNVNRKFDAPINPFRINGLVATITTTTASKEYHNNTDLNDGRLIFYYARLNTNDMKTSEDNAQNSIDIEVYDTTTSTYTNSFKRNSLAWWRNQKHNSSPLGTIHAVDATNSTLYAPPIQFSLAASNISAPTNGTITLTLPRNDGRHVLHVKTDPWLWYIPKKFGSDYSDAINSKCTAHPCFIYVFDNPAAQENIASGAYKGGNTKVYDRGTYNKQGVKVFR